MLARIIFVTCIFIGLNGCAARPVPPVDTYCLNEVYIPLSKADIKIISSEALRAIIKHDDFYKKKCKEYLQ